MISNTFVNYTMLPKFKTYSFAHKVFYLGCPDACVCRPHFSQGDFKSYKQILDLSLI